MHMSKKEYRIPIRFRGEGETNKEAEARIKRIEKAIARHKLVWGEKISFAEAVRTACDGFYK